MVEDIDEHWGLAIVWMDGSRTWYPWARWNTAAPTGFSTRLVDPERYVRAPDFELAPPEFGRGFNMIPAAVPRK